MRRQRLRHTTKMSFTNQSLYKVPYLLCLHSQTPSIERFPNRSYLWKVRSKRWKGSQQQERHSSAASDMVKPLLCIQRTSSSTWLFHSSHMSRMWSGLHTMEHWLLECPALLQARMDIVGLWITRSFKGCRLYISAGDHHNGKAYSVLRTALALHQQQQQQQQQAAASAAVVVVEEIILLTYLLSSTSCSK